jgi:hypothetical protein
MQLSDRKNPLGRRGETSLGKTIVIIAIVTLIFVIILLAAKRILSLMG